MCYCASTQAILGSNRTDCVGPYTLTESATRKTTKEKVTRGEESNMFSILRNSSLGCY